ncbi:hypothetical protein EC915_103201 [Pseudomonas sp. LP_7_YM]|nr:hypothetical protein EC915_103201 [Pseudomonas sp. LP_7_YM]
MKGEPLCSPFHFYAGPSLDPGMLFSSVICTATSILIGASAFGTLLYMTVWSRRQRQRALQDSFAQQRFPTPYGPVSGALLRVVKSSCQLSTAGNTPMELFWYCVGSVPCYFLAVARVRKTSWRGTEVAWTLLTLSEQRMRGACRVIAKQWPRSLVSQAQASTPTPTPTPQTLARSTPNAAIPAGAGGVFLSEQHYPVGTNSLAMRPAQTPPPLESDTPLTSTSCSSSLAQPHLAGAHDGKQRRNRGIHHR